MCRYSGMEIRMNLRLYRSFDLFAALTHACIGDLLYYVYVNGWGINEIFHQTA